MRSRFPRASTCRPHRDDFALPLMRNLRVSDVMTPATDKTLIVASPETPLARIERALRERQVMSVPVLEQGRVVGVITLRDIVKYAPEQLTTTLARQVMSLARSCERIRASRSTPLGSACRAAASARWS